MLDSYSQTSHFFCCAPILSSNIFSLFLLLFSHSVVFILCRHMNCSMQGFPILGYFPELAQTNAHFLKTMPSNHFILCCPLLLRASIFPRIRVFSNELALCIKWPNCWSFSFNISPPNEYSGLISFRTDWFDLFTVQGTLKSLLQHHNLKASFLQHSAFFMVQLSHLYMTSEKTTTLTKWTFGGKVMSLLFNMLSRFVIAFLPRSK